MQQPGDVRGGKRLLEHVVVQQDVRRQHKIELLGRRQDTAANQLLSHALEQLLARSKRLRDTEAGNVNMQLLMWRDGPAVNDAFVRGAADALRSWRQP